MFVEKMAPSCDDSLMHRTSFSSQMAQELQRRSQTAGAGASTSSDRHRVAYSDGEEGSSARSWTPSRGSSLDTDTDTEPRPSRRGRLSGQDGSEEGEQQLLNLDDNEGGSSKAVTVATSPANVHRKEEEDDSSSEERDVLPSELPVISSRLLEFDPALCTAATQHRPQKSPKRMGVHHLHRKDSLTRAQEQGNLLD